MRRWLVAVGLLLFAASPGFARSSEDHATVGKDITVGEGETAGDIACVFCRVRVHGDVRGDIAVAFGRVELDPGRNISGDVAGFGVDLDLAPGANIGGDVSVIGGDIKTEPGATIHGSTASFPGRIWLLLPLVPFLVVIGIIWLIVSIVRRNRYQFPMYPQGRGF